MIRITLCGNDCVSEVKLFIFGSVFKIYSNLDMSKTIKLRKGLNISMIGKADPVLEQAATSEVYALKPGDFPGMMPRLSVKPGQAVKAGEPLFYDKYNPDVVFVAPAGGLSPLSSGESVAESWRCRLRLTILWVLWILGNPIR